MLTISLVTLYQHINAYLWPLIRILALFSTSPIFNEKEVNARLKISVALIITMLISPTLPQNAIVIFSVAGLWVTIQQIIIGTAIGLSIQLIFVAVRHAGEIYGLQMGLSFATFYDAVGGQNMPIMSRILNLLVTLLFLTFNGHLYIINVLADSFYALPIDIKYLEGEDFFCNSKVCRNDISQRINAWVTGRYAVAVSQPDHGNIESSYTAIVYFCCGIPRYAWCRHVGIFTGSFWPRAIF